MKNIFFSNCFTIFVIFIFQCNLYCQVNKEAANEANQIDSTIINVEELDESEEVLEEFVPKTEVDTERKSRRIYREGRIPRNPIPKNSIPRRSLPSNSIPRISLPDNNVPRKAIPRNRIPKRSLEHNQIKRNPLPRNRIPRRSLPRNRVNDDRDEWLQESARQSDRGADV